VIWSINGSTCHRRRVWILGSYINYLKIDVEGLNWICLETLRRLYGEPATFRSRLGNIISAKLSIYLKKLGFEKLIAVEYGDFRNIILKKT